jgi:anti-sigma B factor antagonist
MPSPSSGRPTAAASAGEPPLRTATAALRDGTLVLRVAGEVTVARRGPLERALLTAVAACPPLLVVDLARLGFCDSTVLNALLQARLEAGAGGVRLVLAGPPAQTIRLLRLTRTDRVFTVRPTVETALAPGHGDLFPCSATPAATPRQRCRMTRAALERGQDTRRPPGRPARNQQ